MSQNWQHRIQNHEETPPAGVWDSIAKELDKSDVHKKNISEKKVVQMPFFRWAVAASLLLGVSVFTFIFHNKNDKNSQILASEKRNMKTVETMTSKTNPLSLNIVSPNNNTSALKTSPIKRKKIKSPFRHTITESNINVSYADAGELKPLVKNPVETTKKKITSSNGQEINDITLMDSPNSYVTFVGPNGQEVKISSKFSNIIGYLNSSDTEEYLDKVISEGAYWRGKFKTWRNKMCDDSVAPTPNNFMDIIELGKILSDTQ